MTTRAWRQETGDGSLTLRIQAQPGARSTAVVGGYGDGAEARPENHARRAAGRWQGEC